MASPLSTLFEGLYSINALFIEVYARAEVFALNLPSLCYWMKSISMLCPCINGLSSNGLSIYLPAFFLIWLLSILAYLYTLFILMKTFDMSIKFNCSFKIRFLKCSSKVGLFLDLLSKESNILQ